MDIMELGAIGELVGGVAVIGSLLFVGMQIRMNAKAVQLNSTLGVLESWARVNDSLAHNQELSALVRTAFDPASEVNEETKREINGRLGFFLRAQFIRCESEYVLGDHGLMNDEILVKHLRMFRNLAKTPVGRAWWQGEIADDFRTYSESFVAERRELWTSHNSQTSESSSGASRCW